MGPLDAYVNAGFPVVLAVIFSLGFVSGLSPCGLPTVALVVGYVSKNGASGKSNGFFLSLYFVLGIALVLTILGGLSGYLGGLLSQSKTVFAKGSIGLKIFLALASVIFILLGLWMLKIINFNGINFMSRMQVEKGSGGWGAFLLGLPFGIAASPCTLPVTIAVLLYLAAKGDAIAGMFFMFVFTIGRSIPILVAGTFTGLLTKIQGFGRWQVALEKVGGSVMVIIGVHFILRSMLNIDLLKIIS
jgi:cytochrome c-type biogenesis protein